MSYGSPLLVNLYAERIPIGSCNFISLVIAVCNFFSNWGSGLIFCVVSFFVLGDRDEESALRQVDTDMMEFIFSSLVEYFHLGDAYNVFVLNPKRDIRKGGYGYRLAPDYHRYYIILFYYGRGT